MRAFELKRSPLKGDDGVKTFRDERHGFEIDIPDEWSAPTGEFIGFRSDADQFAFQLPPYEAFNIVVGDLKPEYSLEETRKELRRYVSEKGYEHLRFGGITVLGKQHVWARYLMESSYWTIKYRIVFVGIEYEIRVQDRCRTPGRSVVGRASDDDVSVGRTGICGYGIR